MTDIVVDGTVRVTFTAAIANLSAPTVAELNAGILLQTLLTADGLMGFAADTAAVDNSALNSTFDTVTPGRASYSGTGLRLKRQTPLAGDTSYNTLIRNTVGFLAIRQWQVETASWASAQLLSTYPIACGEVKYVDYEKNTVARYEVPLFIISAPVLRAVVA